MTKLSQKVTSPLKKKFKNNNNMTSTIGHDVGVVNSEIKNSILRGELLRYAQYVDEVKSNLADLKQSNPKYLELAVRIIEISITELPALDIDLMGSVLNNILSQFKEASFNNQEALDFTQEVLNLADILTTKYYLAHLAGGILENTNLKKQFKASIPFIKYILASLNETLDLTKSKNFMNAVKILVNEKADYRKIELLPKIKYTVDNISRKNYSIDVTKLIYHKISAKKVESRLETMVKDIKALEKSGKNIDCVDYLTQNSL